MKFLLGLFIGMIGYSVQLFGQNAQPEVYTGSVSVKQNFAELKNDSVYLDMDFTISGLSVHSSQSLLLTPVLYSRTDSLALSSIRINGKQNDRMYRRKLLFGEEVEHSGKPVYFVMREEPSVTKIISYKVAVAYKQWMDDAGLSLKGVYREYNETLSTIYYNVLTPNLYLTRGKEEKF